jgi:hypothetical protein
MSVFASKFTCRQQRRERAKTSHDAAVKRVPKRPLKEYVQTLHVFAQQIFKICGNRWWDLEIASEQSMVKADLSDEA